MTTRLLALFATWALTGCGSSGSSGPCSDGYVYADPDGHGQRCVRDESDCLSPTACGDPTVVVDCCTPFCGDPDGDQRFTCERTCLVPDCTTAAKCALDERCETYNECSASCVPDLPCEAGLVMADPDGQGFRCVPDTSECFRPIDCAPSANPCCDRSCMQGADGRFTCEEACEDGAAGAAGGISSGEADMAPAFDCYRDADCASWGVGYTCQGCPGWCVPPANACASELDCGVATDVRDCCACPHAFSLATIASDACIAGPDEIPPAECFPEACPAVECEPCADVTGAVCTDGVCSDVSASE